MLSPVVRSPTSIVVRRRQRHELGPCLQRQREGSCYCFKARLEQFCQSCHKWIREGDCIEKNGTAGWTHVFCESDAERGLPSIEQGLRCARVDALHLADDETAGRPPVRRRLTYGGEEEEEATAEAEEAEEEEATESEEEEEEEEATAEEEEESVSSEDAAGLPSFSTEGIPSFLTEEQKRILLHEPHLGGLPVCINALAGCGKTTTIALLCEYLQKHRHPYSNVNILYLVFNKKNETEAMESGKFPKQNMEIRTSHSFVLRYYFGVAHMHDVKPVEDYSLEDITETLRLRQDLKKIFPNDTEAKFKRKVKSVACYIRKTLHNFQASDSQYMEEKHIFYRIRFQDAATLSTRTKWRAEIPLDRYRGWADEFFGVVRERCHNVRDGRGGGFNGNKGGISHDGYMKVAQLERDLTTPYRYVIADEAQDLTPCQADLFWGDPVVRKNRSVFLFGDKYQMLYRFRGAAHSFYNMCAETNSQFHLTGSFRFGENIAEAASIVLEAIDSSEQLIGRVTDNPGHIWKEDAFDNQGVVLCRTNKGIYSYLFFHQPNRWSRLDGSKKAFPSPPSWVYDLESFLAYLARKEDDPINNNDDDDDQSLHEEQDATSVFTYRNEIFSSLNELSEYIEDESDTELLKYLSLLQFLKDQNKSLDDFIESITRSFVPLTGDPDEFDGVVLGTVHKAKGLEFSRVLIYSDYKFNVILSNVIDAKRQNDEASIFYVALSRTKDHLFLSQSAKDCLDKLAEHLRKKRLVLREHRNMQEIRDEVDQLWDTFQRTKPEIAQFQHIPWPAGNGNGIDDDNLLGLDRDMTETEQRQYIRKLRLRYHPDKFLPNFEALIAGSRLRDIIVKRLQEITQACKEVLEGLQNVGEG